MFFTAEFCEQWIIDDLCELGLNGIATFQKPVRSRIELGIESGGSTTSNENSGRWRNAFEGGGPFPDTP